MPKKQKLWCFGKYPAIRMSNGTEKRIIKGLTSKRDPDVSVQIKSINILSERLLYWRYILAQFRKNINLCKKYIIQYKQYIHIEFITNK